MQACPTKVKDLLKNSAKAGIMFIAYEISTCMLK